MRRAGALAPLLLCAGPALAHEGEAHSAAIPWTLDLAVVLPLGLALGLYLAGTLRLWRRAGYGRGVRPWEGASFVAGWAILAGALVSPLHALGERLFTAHMVEHELMMAVAAPLLVLPRPLGAMLFALPQSWRRTLGSVGGGAAVGGLWRALTTPLVATVLHGLAIWIWHVPALFEAALRHEWVHWAQHVSFVLTALFFWWALIHGRARERGYGASVLHVFGTAMHTGVLGALIALSPRVIYPADPAEAARWSLTPLDDQQIAGLVMWVPASIVYLAAALIFAGLWIAHSARSAAGEGAS